MVGISFDFMQNSHGYSNDAIPAQQLPNNFTILRFVVTIQICNEVVLIMTTKSCTCMCVATFLSDSVRYYVRYLK